MGDTLHVDATADTAQVAPASSQPPLPFRNQPRKYEQYAESRGLVNSKPDSMRQEAAFPGYASAAHQPSALALYGQPRMDSLGFANYPPPTPGTRPLFPYFPTRESFSSLDPRLRNDSICLPPPFLTKSLEDYIGGQPLQNPPTQLRSTSIFSSLIQMPGSSGNSISGPSSREASKSGLKKRGDEEGLGIHWDEKAAPPNPAYKRNTKAFDNSSMFWDQMASGMSGLIAGINNDSLNAFLANLQSSGSIDLSNMSTEERRDLILRYINDQNTKADSALLKTPLKEDIFQSRRSAAARRKSLVDQHRLSPTSLMLSKASKPQDEPHLPKTSPAHLDARMMLDALRKQPGPYYAAPEQYPFLYQDPKLRGYAPYSVSPGVAQQQLGMPQQLPQQLPQQMPQQLSLQVSPHMSPQMVQQMSPPTPQHRQQRPQQLQPNPQQAPLPPVSQVPQGRVPEPVYSPLFKNNQYIPPDQVDRAFYQPMRPESLPKQLVDAQEYAKAEDGRPLLGATKVDQLMLVIQAREVGNTAAIKQAPNGNILASPNPDHEKSAVLPPAVDLVGGIEKPARPESPDGPGKKRKRRGRTQQCAYCFKQFNQSTHLDVHVRLHIGYKPFQCTYCHKRFTQGGNLRTHMRLHTGEKPFVCGVCNRNFSRKGNLAAHMLTHNKEKPFECKLDNCDKLFTQLGNLKLHQNKFHLPTLTNLTLIFANITRDALAQLPPEEKELLDYFAKLYKNLNKGIRGRGKGKRVEKIDYTSPDMKDMAYKPYE